MSVQNDTSAEAVVARAIDAAHPVRTGRHDIYEKAMRLVGARHSKGDLVALVNWLLARAEAAEQEKLGLMTSLAAMTGEAQKAQAALAAAALAMRDAAAVWCRERAEIMENSALDVERGAEHRRRCETQAAALEQACYSIRALPLPADAQAALDAVRREAVMRERASFETWINKAISFAEDPQRMRAEFANAIAAIRARGTEGER